MKSLATTGCVKEQPGSLVPGDFQLTRQDFRQIAAMIEADSGIHLPQSKAMLVYSRLARRLRALGMASFRDYCQLVTEREGAGERQNMLAALTTNMTRFFREPHHFDHLAKNVLPPLIVAVRRGGRLRLWSAGCSSGEEPYSIALTLLSLMPDAGNYDIKVLATDIAPNVLAKGKNGVYTSDELDPVSAKMRARWFVSICEGDRQGAAVPMYRVAPELKALVSFRELNLFGTWPMAGLFQAIFCRNVAIYFEKAAQEELWSRFMVKLTQGGVLYLGHSERITGPASKRLDVEAVTTYRTQRGGS
ncbi:MAG TPA: protein-glutamate O-methyltransferase [Methylocella sp.]|nr:protein-glutamate O-methyltransferase [Methylocella sp.]